MTHKITELYLEWENALSKEKPNAALVASLEEEAVDEGFNLREINETLLAGGRWNPDLHPRGLGGRFINVFGLVDLFNFDIGDGRDDFRGKVTKIVPKKNSPGSPDIHVDIPDRFNKGEFTSVVVKPNQVRSATKPKGKIVRLPLKPATTTKVHTVPLSPHGQRYTMHVLSNGHVMNLDLGKTRAMRSEGLIGESDFAYTTWNDVESVVQIDLGGWKPRKHPGLNTPGLSANVTYEDGTTGKAVLFGTRDGAGGQFNIGVLDGFKDAMDSAVPDKDEFGPTPGELAEATVARQDAVAAIDRRRRGHVPFATITSPDEGDDRWTIGAPTEFGDSYELQNELSEMDEFKSVDFDSEGSHFFAYSDDAVVANELKSFLDDRLMDKYGGPIETDIPEFDDLASIPADYQTEVDGVPHIMELDESGATVLRPARLAPEVSPEDAMFHGDEGGSDVVDRNVAELDADLQVKEIEAAKRAGFTEDVLGGFGDDEIALSNPITGEQIVVSKDGSFRTERTTYEARGIEMLEYLGFDTEDNEVFDVYPAVTDDGTKVEHAFQTDTGAANWVRDNPGKPVFSLESRDFFEGTEPSVVEGDYELVTTGKNGDRQYHRVNSPEEAQELLDELSKDSWYVDAELESPGGGGSTRMSASDGDFVPYVDEAGTEWPYPATDEVDWSKDAVSFGGPNSDPIVPYSIGQYTATVEPAHRGGYEVRSVGFDGHTKGIMAYYKTEESAQAFADEMNRLSLEKVGASPEYGDIVDALSTKGFSDPIRTKSGSFRMTNEDNDLIAIIWDDSVGTNTGGTELRKEIRIIDTDSSGPEMVNFEGSYRDYLGAKPETLDRKTKMEAMAPEIQGDFPEARLTRTEDIKPGDFVVDNDLGYTRTRKVSSIDPLFQPQDSEESKTGFYVNFEGETSGTGMTRGEDQWVTTSILPEAGVTPDATGERLFDVDVENPIMVNTLGEGAGLSITRNKANVERVDALDFETVDGMSGGIVDAFVGNMDVTGSENSYRNRSAVHGSIKGKDDKVLVVKMDEAVGTNTYSGGMRFEIYDESAGNYLAYPPEKSVTLTPKETVAFYESMGVNVPDVTTEHYDWIKELVFNSAKDWDEADVEGLTPDRAQGIVDTILTDNPEFLREDIVDAVTAETGVLVSSAAAALRARVHGEPDTLLAFGRGRFNPDLHPRGRDGKFIDVLGLIKLFDFDFNGKRVPEGRGKVLNIIPDKRDRGNPDIVVELPNKQKITVKRDRISHGADVKAKLKRKERKGREIEKLERQSMFNNDMGRGIQDSDRASAQRWRLQELVDEQQRGFYGELDSPEFQDALREWVHSGRGGHRDAPSVAFEKYGALQSDVEMPVAIQPVDVTPENPLGFGLADPDSTAIDPAFAHLGDDALARQRKYYEKVLDDVMVLPDAFENRVDGKKDGTARTDRVDGGEFNTQGAAFLRAEALMRMGFEDVEVRYGRGWKGDKYGVYGTGIPEDLPIYSPDKRSLIRIDGEPVELSNPPVDRSWGHGQSLRETSKDQALDRILSFGDSEIDYSPEAMQERDARMGDPAEQARRLEGLGITPGAEYGYNPTGVPYKDMPAEELGSKENPIQTNDPMEAVKALHEGKHVQLQQIDQVSTMLDELGRIASEAREKGEDAGDYDLCKVTVPGTNLFCVEAKGIPRIKMPQLLGIPTPGSRADKLPKNDSGEADIGPAFVAHLEAKGISVTETRLPASHLRASQSELVGAKVSGMMGAMQSGNPKAIQNIRESAIFATTDNYVVDGHHRWAAVVGLDLSDGVLSGDIDMPVRQIDMDILDVLNEAADFAVDFGIPPMAGSSVEGAQEAATI